MTIEECYARVGGDWAGVLGRLGAEARVERFLRMVPGDPTFQNLSDAMGQGDWEAAFRSAHSLKGLALNLGLTPLANAASVLTESLRDGGSEGADVLFQSTREAYDATLAAIDAWEGGGAHE